MRHHAIAQSTRPDRPIVEREGVSGDGVDQDDMIAFLGVEDPGGLAPGIIVNAFADRRADTLRPQGVRLRYVQCPQAPFRDSDEQHACAGK